MITKGKSKRKPTGGRYKKARDKRLHEIGGEPTHTKIGKKKVKTTRIKGGMTKLRTLRAELANIFDRKTKSYKTAAIKTVIENPSSKHFVRRNIITKGTIIETDLGKARVTNRPGQEGTINAVLLPS